MRCISLLGATGSIGMNVLDVVRQFPERYKVVAMAAGTNVRRLAELVKEFCPELISVADEQRAYALQQLLPREFHNRIVHGPDGNVLVAAFAPADLTLSAIVGAAGLLPTLAAIAGR